MKQPFFLMEIGARAGGLKEARKNSVILCLPGDKGGFNLCSVSSFGQIQAFMNL